MMSFRRWAIALALTVMGSAAQAGFYGDTQSVSLTVHTTGAADQIVWSGASVTPPVGGVDLSGDSDPGAPGDPLAWSLEYDTSGSFLLSVDNLGGATETIEPLLLNITGIDGFGDLSTYTVQIGGVNTLGVLPGDISWTSSTITVSSNVLNTVGPLGTLKVQIVVVPEASTVAMMSLVATGVAGYVVRRRRRNG